MRNKEVRLSGQHRFKASMRRIGIVAGVFLCSTAPCFATTYVQNGASGILNEVKWAALIATIVMAVVYGIGKKETVKGLVFLVVGGIFTFFCMKPTAIADIGSAIAKGFGF